MGSGQAAHILTCDKAYQQERRAVAIRLIDRIDECCKSEAYRKRHVQQWKSRMRQDSKWDVRNLLREWGIVYNIKKRHPHDSKDSKRSEKRSSHAIDRSDVWLESACFGAFRSERVHTTMIGSNSSSSEVEVLVRDVRSILVGYACGVWADACADDDIDPFIPDTKD